MSISFSGLASGLDTSSWITSLTQLRQAKVTTLEAQKTSIVAAQSTLQGIKSYFSSFRSSIEKITDAKFNVSSMDVFSKKVANVSNAAILSATAKSNAVEGSYEVKVNNVATQTQVKSGYRYKTTLVSTTKASTASFLKNIGIGYGTNPDTGITSGNIEITHDGVKSSIYVNTNEDMNSFLVKLHDAGITANFDNNTGIFSIGVSAEDINDVGNTNILNKLKITSINYGYTGNQLKIEESHEVYQPADADTALSVLGVQTGTLSLTTAHGIYEVEIEEEDTIASLVKALNDEGIEATYENGIFSIHNAVITDDGDTHLIEKFGLTDSDIVSQTQASEGLTYQTVYTATTTANLGVKLSDIDGVELTDEETIVVKNAEGTIHTLTVDTTTTIGDLVNMMNAPEVGLDVSFNEYTGILSINDGWIIEGGSFDVETAFGLQYTGIASTVNGSHLTVTTTTISGATGAIKLKDLTTAVTNGTIKVTDAIGNVHNLAINANEDIDTFISDIHTLGLGASFDDTTGVLTLVGGSYTTEGLADSEKSNILNVFFGEDTLTPSEIDSATSTSQALRVAVSETHLAEGTTTLDKLNMTAGTYTATFKTGNTEVSVGINSNMELNDLVEALRIAGIDAEFNSETHKIQITDGEFIGITGSNFAEIMDFTSTITGRYATSDIVRAQNITTANELTSASAVYYTDYTTTTVTTSESTTVALETSSAPLTYQSVVTTVIGNTAGVEVTGAEAVTYNNVTTTPKTQTTGELTYNITTPGSTITTTVGLTLTGTEVNIGGVTSPCSQTGEVLTYTTTSVSASHTETVGIEGIITSTLTYSTTFTINTEATTSGITTTLQSGILTYNSTVVGTTGAIRLGQTGDIVTYSNTQRGDRVESQGAINHISENTRISELCETGIYYITHASGAITAVTIDSTTTYGDIADIFNDLGYNAGVKDSRFWFQPSSSCSGIGTVSGGRIDDIVSIAPDLAAALGLTGKIGAGQTYTMGYSNTEMYASSANFTIHASTSGWNSTDTLSALGFEDNMTIEVYNPTTKNTNTITISSTTTLRNALKTIKQNGLNVYVNGTNMNATQLGSMTGSKNTIVIKQTSGGNVLLNAYNTGDTSSDGELSGTFFDPSEFGYGRTYTSPSSYTTSIVATTETVLGSLGLTGTGEITIWDGTEEVTVTFDENSTINLLCGRLNGSLGTNAAYLNGSGQLVIQNNKNSNGHYIIGANSVAEGWLENIGIAVGDGETYNITGGTSHTKTVTTTATSNTQLSVLSGWPQMGSLDTTFVNQDGNTYTVHATDTVSSLVSTMTAAGLNASFNQATGEFQFTQTEDHYITEMDEELVALLNVRPGLEHTYNTIVIGETTTTITRTAGRDTTLSQLGFNQTGTIVLGDGTSIEVDGNWDLGQISGALRASDSPPYKVNLGFGSDDGKIHILANNSTTYIASMTPELADTLGIQVGKDFTYTTTGGGTMTTSTTLGDLGLTNSSYIYSIATDTATVSFNQDSTVGSIMNALTSTGNFDVTLENGVLEITPLNDHYIDENGTSLDLMSHLGITNIGEGYSYDVNIETGEPTVQSTIIELSTTFDKLGLTNGSTACIQLNNGNYIILDGNSTVDDLREFLSEDNDVSFDLTNGVLTIGDPSDEDYITYSDLSSIGIRAGEGFSYNSDSEPINATTLTQLSTLGLGNGNYNIKTDGGTITVTNANTIGEIIEALDQKGFTAALNAQNKFVITPREGHYIESMSSALAVALGNIETGKDISYTVTDEETETLTHTAALDTTLGELGLTNNAFIVTHDGTVTVTAEDTITSLMEKLTGANITSNYDPDTGIFTLGATDDENYVINMSNELASILGNIVVGEHSTFQVNTGESEEEELLPILKTVTEDQTFGDLGIETGGIINLSNGQSVTVNSATTISDFLTDISGKGITATLTNGIFNLRSQNNTYITGCSGENILSAMNIVESTYTTGDGRLGTTKLKDLKSSTNTPLDITSGLIKAYKNGIANDILIDENSTLEELANQLSSYNIQMLYSSGDSGRIYFTSSGNSYLSEVSEGSNLLTALGITSWTAVKNTSSQKLEYESSSDEVINSNTALVNLKNADGTSVGIKTGKFKIVSNGINYEGIIDSTTTVGDLFLQLQPYGFSGSINSNGQITLNTSNDNTYLEAPDTPSEYYSDVVEKLFSDWTFGNIYTSNSMDVTEINTVDMTSGTALSDIDQGTYIAGKFVINSSRTGNTTINLSETATVGDFMSILSYHGFNSYIENGRLIVQNDGYTTLENYNVPSEASNVLSLLGLNTSAWEQPGFYTGEAQTTTSYNTVLEAATETTKLSALRDGEGTELNISTGEYWIYTNGVKHVLNLESTDISLRSFMNTLSDYGITTTLNTGDDQSILKIVGSGNSYLETSNAVGASNIVQKLFGSNAPSTLYDYSGYLQTSELVSTTMIANLGTAVSDYDHDSIKSEGIFALSVDGNYSEINITSYETFGSLIEKFERAGVTATLTDGVFKLETGNKTFVVDEEHTTSNLISNLGLHYSNNLGGFAASSDTVTQTTTTIEDRTLSVAKYADYDTQLGLLNISSGTLSVYRNGSKQLIEINNTETFSQLQTRLNTAFGGDINIDFADGKLRFFSNTEGVDVQVGSASDTSNISSICGFSQGENGYVVSARELYKVNASSVITDSDLFRYGDVTEGTFIIGDETFTINSNTTIQNVIAQINSSDKANASAYWDSVDGKLVITSRTTGASMVNIEAGTSNFTDILGLTNSEWENGSVKVTRIQLASQELGNNAKFSINGTNFQSASNVVTSDISRIQGLTLNLKSSSMGESVTVTVEKDAEAVTEAVGEFVEAYNGLVENVDNELSTGNLKDQSTLKFIKQQIRSLLVNTFSGGTTFRNLAALGISTSSGNTVKAGDVSNESIEYLYFDSEKFMESFNKDSTAVKNMLVGSDETPGILLQVENIVENALTSGTGYFSIADKSYSDKINSINEKIKKANQAVEAYKARLESKFQSMDLLISQMQNQYNSFLNSSLTSTTTSSYFS